ncbi:MAG: SAM-dependent methyltransferase, partial [Xanthomonadaceae bacterium]|nr:SAM-dependent methyltransferase [Xanthomonadaceae bacterium]
MTLARYFEQVWQQGDDPFGYRSRWYEARKRDLLLATLPRPLFERGWEIGCANGEL